jgi:site-specific DNA-methyltransferase (adenine-specific)
MKIQTLQIKDLTPDPNNARQHDDKNLKAIQGSLKEFGQRKPIVITQSGVIVAGNGTVEAAKRLGWLEIQAVTVPGDWTPEQTKAFALADNRTAELAAWSPEVLASQLVELEAAGFEIEEFGFEKIEVAEEPREIVEDEVPESAPQRSSLGDVWQLGRHRLMVGDATKEEDVKKLMSGEKASLVFTDPPYGVEYTDSLGRSIKNDELVDDGLERFLFYSFKCAVQSSEKDTAWYVFHSDRFSSEFVSAMKKAGVRVRQQIIWVKGEGVEGTSRVKAPAIGGSHFRALHEACWYGSTGTPFNLGDRTTTTVWTVSRPTTGTFHPTQKPIPLIVIALKNSSQTGSIVLDLFGGSGSTLIACEQTGRKARLMELDPKYCDVILTRWETLTGQTAKLVSKTP